MMNGDDPRSQRTLEIILILVTFGLTVVLYVTASFKIAALNLFYLPVVLAGFFLGRYRAGILALFSVVMASAVAVLDLNSFGAFASPIAAILAVMIWSAVLGLTAILVGTLNDERIAKSTEAHEAHVAVVEVLSRYLQSANVKLQNRAVRASELSEQVARKMRLSNREIDDIRVASLLMDIENIEITSRVIEKAVGTLEEDSHQHTIAGTELVQSLGSVLTGVFPLLVNQADTAEISEVEIPFGARILRTVRAYQELKEDLWDDNEEHAQDAVEELRNDLEANHHPAVLYALSEIVTAQNIARTEHDSVDEIEAILAEHG